MTGSEGEASMTSKLSPSVLHALEAVTGHLQDRSAVLFLGAGINHGTKASDGTAFPLAQSLASLIANKLLNDPKANLDLPDASDMARRKLGDKAFNEFIYSEFSKYSPSTAHLEIVQLPWNCIYTTNYDLLIEQATQNPQISVSGKFKSICSAELDLTLLDDSSIPYYKLHGSIDFANTYEGRLILTREDYRKYEQNRTVLFRRLRADLSTKSFIFIGYGLKDENFRAILDEVREALGTHLLPASFAVRREFSSSEESYWKDKYNVHLLDIDATEFLIALKETWETVPEGQAAQQWSSQSIAHSELARYKFPKIGVSFFRLIPAACVGSSDPKQFFLGGSYTWTDAREKIAPYRDNFWTLLDAMFADFTDPKLPPSAYLVTGPAGTGKSTLCRALAYDVAKDFGLPVLIHIPGTPLDPHALGTLINTEAPERLLVLIHDGATYANDLDLFIEELKRLQIPASILIEERKNEWNVAAHKSVRRFAPLEIELGAISESEIAAILDALTRFDCLGKLKGLDREHQIGHFASVAEKDLLVALREITTDSSFDEIIRDEFNSIPSDLAKKAYLYVAAVGQANVPLRYEHLVRILGLTFEQLGTEILRPTDRVLIEGEQFGNSIHNGGFTLKTRHPVIASVIFSSAAPDDETRYQAFSDLVVLLDPGYIEDKRLLEEIVRREEIIGTLSDPERKRAIFDLITKILPKSAFVLQHRAMLERVLDNPEGAVKYARQALEIEPSNPSLKNTLGLALTGMARVSTDSLKKQGYLQQAEKIFQEGLQKDSSNPYNYVGLEQIMRVKAEGMSQSDKVVNQAKILSLLEEAYEATAKSEIIAKRLAEQQINIGETSDALNLVVTALKSKPSDTKLRILEVHLRQKLCKDSEALQSALDGLKYDPNSWKLNHLAARLLKKTGASDSAIRGHYEAARRQQKGDINLAIEYGAFLFTRDFRQKAAEVFNETQNLNLSSNEKRFLREWWCIDETQKRKNFSGVVKSTKGAVVTIIAIPENFETTCWQPSFGKSQLLRVNDKVIFQVAFNAFGAQARILQ